MDWLNLHAYFAVWLAPIAAIAAALIQTNGMPKLADVNWWLVLLYVTFSVCLGGTFSQSFDHDRECSREHW
jgi:NhaP-type Na+/H+ or K+/H+ antiporter